MDREGDAVGFIGLGGRRASMNGFTDSKSSVGREAGREFVD